MRLIQMCICLLAALLAGCGGADDAASRRQPVIAAAYAGYFDAQTGQYVDSNPNGTPAQAYRLYRAAFDRAADPTGLGYHITQIAIAGHALSEIAASFVTSAEFTAKYGQLTPAGFITQLYANVLHRTPDAAGLAFWTERLTTGASRGDILVGFSESAENKNQTAQSVSQGVRYAPWASFALDLSAGYKPFPNNPSGVIVHDAAGNEFIVRSADDVLIHRSTALQLSGLGLIHTTTSLNYTSNYVTQTIGQVGPRPGGSDSVILCASGAMATVAVSGTSYTVYGCGSTYSGTAKTGGATGTPSGDYLAWSGYGTTISGNFQVRASDGALLTSEGWRITGVSVDAQGYIRRDGGAPFAQVVIWGERGIPASPILQCIQTTASLVFNYRNGNGTYTAQGCPVTFAGSLDYAGTSSSGSGEVGLVNTDTNFAAFSGSVNGTTVLDANNQAFRVRSSDGALVSPANQILDGAFVANGQVRINGLAVGSIALIPNAAGATVAVLACQGGRLAITVTLSYSYQCVLASTPTGGTGGTTGGTGGGTSGGGTGGTTGGTTSGGGTPGTLGVSANNCVTLHLNAGPYGGQSIIENTCPKDIVIDYCFKFDSQTFYGLDSCQPKQYSLRNGDVVTGYGSQGPVVVPANGTYVDYGGVLSMPYMACVRDTTLDVTPILSSPTTSGGYCR